MRVPRAGDQRRGPDRFALQLACWGDPDGRRVSRCWTRRRRARWGPGGAAALGAVTGDGEATGRGVRMARLGMHPRLARALLDAAPQVGARRAAEVVALLTRNTRARGRLAAAWARLGGRRRAGAAAGAAACRGRRFRGAVAGSAADIHGRRRPDGGAGHRTGRCRPRPRRAAEGDGVAGLVTALAIPERMARARATGRYLMAGGTGGELAGGSLIAGRSGWRSRWRDRRPGAASARGRPPRSSRGGRAGGAALCRGRGGGLGGRRRRGPTGGRLGAIVLAEHGLTSRTRLRTRSAVARGCGRRDRTAALGGHARRGCGTGWRCCTARWANRGPMCPTPRCWTVPEWLGPELSRARRRADLARIAAGQALARCSGAARGPAGRAGAGTHRGAEGFAHQRRLRR